MNKPKLNTLKPSITTLDIRRGSQIAIERIRGYELTKIRKRIARRDEYTCQICGRSTADGEVDHIVPLHRGGAESDENRQWLCRECHGVKSEQEEKGRG
jgi:5-methylcytosine-specific restriction endonuclease McrA